MNTQSAYQEDTQLLLITQNRYNGNAESTVLNFRKDGGNFVVAARNESSHYKPDWYLNLKEEPVVQLTIAGSQLNAIAKTPVGTDRLKIWPLIESLAQQSPQVLPRDTTAIVFTPMQ
ncbi:MAG TPA: hypothetical protein DCM54_04495 [Gammaproteobacteria bacterium]|nr:hypothetical protein [Gammaproteobacteria bacterium]|tara:strand:- start:408 stop:758 length:351 start_codon:yes stop_codon:yes gene_type:complete